MKRLIKVIKSYFSEPLPVGMAEFMKWSDDIIELSGKFADKDSMRFAIASILIHADARHGSLSKKYFVDRLVKSAANQVASQVFQDVKQAQALAAKAAEEAAKLAEDTASKEVVSNVSEVL